MIDLHAHILPEMDDGSNSTEMSLAMLRQMAAQGITKVCATSHFYAERNDIDTFCERRAEAYRKIESALEPDMPKILLGAEVAYFPRMSDETQLNRLCLEGTRTLMLEMPFCDWNGFQIEEINTLVLDLGYEVILVHPERFLFSKNNRSQLERLMELPIGLQVNAGSLLRWRSRKTALQLLDEASCPLLGSDTHNLTVRPPNLKEGRSVIERKFGSAFWLQMQQNAERMVENAFAIP